MQGYKCWDEKLQNLRPESGSTCWSVRCLVSSLDLPKALPETCGVVCSFAQYDHDDDDDDDDYDYDDDDDDDDEDDVVVVGLVFWQQEMKISEVVKFVVYLKACRAQGSSSAK